MASKAANSSAVGRSMRSASKNPPLPPSSSKAASSSKATPSNSAPRVAGGSQAVTVPMTGKHAPKAAAPVVPIKLAGSAANVPSAAQAAVSKSGGRRFTSPLKPVVLNDHQESASTAQPAAEMPKINDASSAALFAMISSKVPSFLRFANRWHELSMSGRDLIISYNPRTFVEHFIQDMSTTVALDRPTATKVFDAIAEYVAEDESLIIAKRSDWVTAHCEFTGIHVPPEFANARRGRSQDDVNGSQLKRARADTFVDLDADNPGSETEDRLFERIRQLQILNATTVWGEKAGFTIVPHEDILKMYKRAASDVTAANINASRSANITWPKLDKLTKEAWIKFDTDWWDCVVEAVQNGVYQSPMSLVKLHIVSDVQLDLGIASSDWFTISEIDFIRKAYGHFGNNNKEEALVLLKQTQCIVHSTTIKPDVFLAVLSAYNTKFLRTLDLQIAPSIKKWPAHGQVKYGPVELVSIRKAFKDGFATSKDRSESCKHCFEVCTQNPSMPHKDLYTELRVHFQEDVKALQRPTLHGGSAIADTKHSNSRDGRVNGGRGGAVSGRRDSSPRDSSPGKRGRDRPSGGPKFPVVAGKDRCVYCGDYTNHYGHGASMCPVKGTKHAKPASYKWKASDQEPKPIIPDDDYKQLKKDKADMFKQNAANRIQYRAKTANKVEQYSSFAADVALTTVDSCSPPDSHVVAEFVELISHDGQPLLESPPSRSTMIDIVQMGERFSSKADALSLEDIGYSERFFAVAKFHSAASSVINPHSTYKHALHFTREITKGRYKRAPRCIHIEVGASHSYNVISPSALSQGSAFGKLKIVEEKKLSEPQTDPRRMVLLEFCVKGKDSTVSSAPKQDWFTVECSHSMSPDVAIVTPSFAAAQGIQPSDYVLHIDSNSPLSNAVVGRVFFDTGAQMSCISPHLVTPGLCHNRTNVNVTVMQGVHHAGHSKEAVFLHFDLFDNDMNPTRHCAWFLVWENPYGIILGDSFCDQFTTWKQRLMSWSCPKAKTNFKLPTQFSTWSIALDAVSDNAEQITAPKRPKTDLSLLQSTHPVTGAALRHRNAGSRPVVHSLDHKNYIPFDGLRPAGILHESARRIEQIAGCKIKEKRFKTILQSLPKDERAAFDVVEMQGYFYKDQDAMCRQIKHDILGLPVGLMMGSGAGGIVRRAWMFEPLVHVPKPEDEIVTPEIAAQTKAEQYLLRRASARDGWAWFDDDTHHYEQLLAMEHQPPSVIRPTPLTASQKYFVQWLTTATATARDKGVSVAWTAAQDRVVKDLEQRAAAAATAAVAAVETSAKAAATVADQPLKPGKVVKFKDCIRLPEFNGRLGRLYELCTEGDTRWKVRVLGRNHGQFVIVSEKNFDLHVEQKAFASSANANYHDVGIDDTGQPIESNEDAPKPVHRQFGREYSASLTKRIKELIEQYPLLFDGDISTPCDFEEMEIKLKPNAILPAKARYYRNTPMMREEVRRQIQEQLDAGIISKTSTPVVSNILMVKRPHMPGKYRFVVDYRLVNDATVPDVLLMPDVKSQHDRLANKKIFGAIDISSYYRLIKLREDCRYLTGFATEDGTYVYNRVPMGVKNACSHAQRVLQDKLADDPILGINGANIRNYFDDIAWGANSEDEFMKILKALLDFGVSNKLKYNIDKSCFGVDSITHVGFIADKDGIRIDPERTRDIVEMQAPKSTHKVQSVLGVLNFVRNFIPNFSIKAKFLTDRLEKSAVKRDAGKTFVWNSADDVAFAELKSLVASAPLLSVMDYSKDIYIRCDSSRYGAGAVLFQYDAEGRELPVCYASRKYTPTETRYSTFQQEMGCVVWALERFQEYTLGYKVIVETDHRNISFVKRSAMPQLARWRMRLEAFDFEVHYRCGALQQVADGLSRSACDEQGIDDVAVHYHDVLPECAMSNAGPAESLKLVHVEDVCVEYSSTAFPETSDDEVDFFPLEVDGDNNIADDIDPQVPPLPWNDAAAVKSIITSVHNDVVGHGGVLVTLQRLLRKGRPDVSRKQMLIDIDAYLSGCVGCQKMRKRSSGSATTRRVISGSPFSDLSVDILKLPFPDAHGNAYIVVIVDNFSHWVTTYACANKSAVCAARALIHFVGTFGTPLRIRSDGGGEFVNDIVQQLNHMLECKQIVVQPYQHTANGVVERVNRSVLEKLRFILFDRRIRKQPKLQWTDLLPLAQRIVNASTHSAIGTSPARLIFGDHVDLDRCLLSRPPQPIANKPIPDYIDQLSAMQFAMMEAANDHQLAVQQKVIAKAERMNAGKPTKQLHPGDLVMVKPLSDFPHDKLAPSQLGPLHVVELLEGGRVQLRNPHHNKLSIVSDFQCELFDASLVSTIEGIKSVAETDGFEFAVDGILAHGLLTDDDAIDPTPLPPSHVRRTRAKNYAFLIKWTGYETPTWIAFKAARRLPHFANYVSQFPSLKLNEHN